MPVGSSREVSLDAHRVQTTIAQPLTPTQLDLDSITNASRLLSAETDLEQLFAKMMTLVIAIRAKREGDRVKVSVADRGPGIPEAERQKLAALAEALKSLGDESLWTRLNTALVWKRLGRDDVGDRLFEETLAETRATGDSADWVRLCNACNRVLYV